MTWHLRERTPRTCESQSCPLAALLYTLSIRLSGKMASTSTTMSVLRSTAGPSRPPQLAVMRTYATAAPYSPSSSYSDQVRLPSRPPRPASPGFFTGRPTFHVALSALSTALKTSQDILRAEHIFPLPTALPHLPAPKASWVSSSDLATRFSFPTKTSSHRSILDILNEMHHLRHVAAVAGQQGVVRRLDSALAPYERTELLSAQSTNSLAARRGQQGVDEWGRTYGAGRRKESSAQVWIVPAKSALPFLGEGQQAADTTLPTAEILVNHLPLAEHFTKPADRDVVLRPLRLAGLLGAYNVFALARGGGTTGQAGAVALGLARALAIMREDTRDVLKKGMSRPAHLVYPRCGVLC